MATEGVETGECGVPVGAGIDGRDGSLAVEKLVGLRHQAASFASALRISSFTTAEYPRLFALVRRAARTSGANLMPFAVVFAFGSA